MIGYLPGVRTRDRLRLSSSYRIRLCCIRTPVTNVAEDCEFTDDTLDFSYIDTAASHTPEASYSAYLDVSAFVGHLVNTLTPDCR